MPKLHSQFDEEEVILKFFSGVTNGHLLDIGAFDGIEMSNSRGLIEQGWSGVLVEPVSHNIDRLLGNNQHYANRVRIVQAAVSARPGLSRLFMDTTPTRPWAATINPELLAVGHVEVNQAVEVYVPTIPIHELERFGPYDFITIDAEWEDLAILKTCPVTLLDRCKLLCIETRHDTERETMKQLLEFLDFKVIHETPPNIIAKNENH